MSLLDPLLSSGNGDVVGPTGAVDNAVARFDGATGKLIQSSPVSITDTGIVRGAADPALATDLATKQYVDGLFSGGGLPTTLAANNTTGGNNIHFTVGDAANFLGEISVKKGGTEYIRTVAATALELRVPTGESIKGVVNGVELWRTDAGGIEYRNAATLDWIGSPIAIQRDGTTYYSGIGGIARIDTAILEWGTSGFATSGNIRLPNGFTLMGRNNAGTQNVTVLQLSSGDIVTLGEGADSPGVFIEGNAVHRLRIASGDVLVIRQTRVDVSVPSVVFEDDVVAPVIGQNVHLTAAGEDLTIRAQQGAATFDGGALSLVGGAPGAGGAPGDVGIVLSDGTGKVSVSTAGVAVLFPSGAVCQIAESPATVIATFDGGSQRLDIGVLEFGASGFATTGAIRLRQLDAIVSAGTSADIQALTVNATDRIIVGEDTDAVEVQLRSNSTHSLVVGAVTKFFIGSTFATFSVPTVRFDAAVVAPTITQVTHASAAGEDLTIQAQQGAPTFAGGNTQLLGGAPGSGGAKGQALIGLHDLSAGISVSPSAIAAQVVTGTFFQINEGGSNILVTVDASRVELEVAEFRFEAAVASPKITQETAGGATGQELNISAQPNNHATLAAGRLALQSAANAGAGPDGDVAILDAAGVKQLVWDAVNAKLDLGDTASSVVWETTAGGLEIQATYYLELQAFSGTPTTPSTGDIRLYTNGSTAHYVDGFGTIVDF